MKLAPGRDRDPPTPGPVMPLQNKGRGSHGDRGRGTGDRGRMKTRATFWVALFLALRDLQFSLCNAQHLT